MNETYEIEKTAFEIPPDRGYLIRGSYLKEPQANAALIQIYENDILIDQFLFPAYKIWNIAPHSRDIITSLIEKNDAGLRMAAWNGISGTQVISPSEL